VIRYALAALAFLAAPVQANSTWTTTQLGDGTKIFCPPSCIIGNPEADLGARGFQASLHAGRNWTVAGGLVIGAEASLGYANAERTVGSTPGWFDPPSLDRITANYQWNASLAARAGFVAGPALLYGLAGGSLQKMALRYDCPGSPAVPTSSWCTSGSFSETKDEVHLGWLAGLGVEWRLSQAWLARLDYRYAKYPDQEYTFFAGTADVVSAKVTLSTQALGLGLLYQF
jgi:opacity protein-like surface antigen